MKEVLEALVNQAAQLNWLEAIAVIFGLLSVWFSMKENIWVYPTGIISVLIFIYLTIPQQLYGEAGINAYYLVASLYGWYYWTHTGNEKPQIRITVLGTKQTYLTIFLGLLTFFILRFGLSYTDTDVATLDALSTSSAIIGMWLMAKKKLENWIAWIITDFINTPLYAYKGLYFASFQFFVFTILAIWGYVSWKRTYTHYDK